jgi:hypothetical protein
MAQNNRQMVDIVSKYNEQFAKGMPSVASASSTVS